MKYKKADPAARNYLFDGGETASWLFLLEHSMIAPTMIDPKIDKMIENEEDPLVFDALVKSLKKLGNPA